MAQLYVVTVCLSILRIRQLWTSGRRLQQRGQQITRSFTPSIEAALSRRGVANFVQSLEIFTFLEMQLRVCFRASDKTNRDMSFLYQLGRVSLYIGQGLVARTSSIRSGVPSRLRERLR
eukprot:5417357-Pyramimonas_sp.AAC.1